MWEHIPLQQSSGPPCFSSMRGGSIQCCYVWTICNSADFNGHGTWHLAFMKQLYTKTKYVFIESKAIESQQMHLLLYKHEMVEEWVLLKRVRFCMVKVDLVQKNDRSRKLNFTMTAAAEIGEEEVVVYEEKEVLFDTGGRMKIADIIYIYIYPWFFQGVRAALAARRSHSTTSNGRWTLTISLWWRLSLCPLPLGHRSRNLWMC